MDESSNMGNGCGQKSPQASRAATPPPIAEAETAPAMCQPAADPVDGQNGENEQNGQNEKNEPDDQNEQHEHSEPNGPDGHHEQTQLKEENERVEQGERTGQNEHANSNEQPEQNEQVQSAPSGQNELGGKAGRDVKNEPNERKDQDHPSDGNNRSPSFHAANPTTAIPKPVAGMGLPSWLKLIIKPDEQGGVDQFALVDAYHAAYPPPYMGNELLTRLVTKIFAEAGEHEEETGLYIVGVRWLNANEAAAAFAAGHESANVRGVSTTRRNAARVIDFLLTMGGDKLREEQAVGGQGDAEPTQRADSVMPSGTNASGPTPPPPPPPSSAGAGSVPAHGLPLPPRPPRDIEREFNDLIQAATYGDLVKWLQAVLFHDGTSYIDSLDVTQGYESTYSDSASKLPVDATLMFMVIVRIFPSVTVIASGGDDAKLIWGLKWREIEGKMLCVAIKYPIFPEKARNEVRVSSLPLHTLARL